MRLYLLIVLMLAACAGYWATGHVWFMIASTVLMASVGVVWVREQASDGLVGHGIWLTSFGRDGRPRNHEWAER